MRYSRFKITALLISTCVTMVVLAAGCRDAEQRAAARDTVEKIRIANQHIDNAEGLIANPVIVKTKDGERVKMPITEVMLQLKKGDVRVAGGIMNPDALSELDKAESIIKEAVSSNDAAPADVKAMTKAALGRIYMTRGLFYSLKSAIERQQAFDAMLEAEPLVAMLASENSFVDSYEKLVSMSDEDIVKIEKEAGDAVKKLDAELKKTKDNIATLEKNRGELLSSSRLLMEEGKKLRISSGEASGTRALELYDQAREKETEADKAVADARESELQIVSLKDTLEILETQHAWDSNKLAAAKEAAGVRSGEKGDYKATITDRKTAIKTLKGQIEKIAKTVSDAYSAASASEDMSLKAYDEASVHFKAADAMNRVSAVLNQDAGVQMAAGDLCFNASKDGAATAKFLTDVKAVWGGGSPATIAGMDKYSQNAESRKSQAEKYFNAAKVLYALDVSMAEPKLRGVVQRQLAMAHIQLYKLLGNQTSRDEAIRILDEAMKGSEQSDELKQLRESLLSQ